MNQKDKVIYNLSVSLNSLIHANSQHPGISVAQKDPLKRKLCDANETISELEDNQKFFHCANSYHTQTSWTYDNKNNAAIGYNSNIIIVNPLEMHHHSRHNHPYEASTRRSSMQFIDDQCSSDTGSSIHQNACKKAAHADTEKIPLRAVHASFKSTRSSRLKHVVENVMKII